MKRKIKWIVTGAAALCMGTLAGAGARVDNGAQVDDGYAVLAAGVAHDRYFDMAVDGGNAIAVGESGRVSWSADRGRTWQLEQAPTELALLGVALRGKRAIAVGQMGQILLRAGDGQWKSADSGTTERLLQVAMNDYGLAFAVGAFGTLLKSGDNGETWSRALIDWTALFGVDEAAGASGAAGEPQLYSVQVDNDGTVTVAGELSYIVQSRDSGDHWRVVHRNGGAADVIPPTIFSLHIRNNGRGFAVGQSGLVLKTADGGQSWTPSNTGVDAILLAVASVDGDTVAAVGMRVGIQSRDGGRSWTALDGLDLNTEWYSGAGSFDGERDVVAVGHSGRIIRIPQPAAP